MDPNIAEEGKRLFLDQYVGHRRQGDLVTAVQIVGGDTR
jgi:hypothetical protein